MKKRIVFFFSLISIVFHDSINSSSQQNPGISASVPRSVPRSASGAELDPSLFANGVNVADVRIPSRPTHSAARSHSSAESVFVDEDGFFTRTELQARQMAELQTGQIFEQEVNPIAGEVEYKLRQKYGIYRSVPLQPLQTEQIKLITDSLTPHRAMVINDNYFRWISFNGLLNVKEALKIYDHQRRFWLGSLIVDLQYEDILEAERKRIEAAKGSGTYVSVLHGSVSRYEQRQRFVEERENVLKSLLEQEYLKERKKFWNSLGYRRVV